MTLPVRPPILQAAIVGASGSGKTWLATRICSALAPAAVHLRLDDFYRDLSALSSADRASINFDDPNAIDWACVRSAIEAFSQSRAAEVPNYDFATHTRKADWRRVKPVSFIIWDGLWLLHETWLRERFGWSAFVESSSEQCLERRLARDVLERGRTPESVRRQFVQHVEPMRQKFVEPQRPWATCHISSPWSEPAFSELLSSIRTAAHAQPPPSRS